MSGGRFDYFQNKFDDVIEELESIIDKNGKPKTKEELQRDYTYMDPDWLKQYPQDAFHPQYSNQSIEEFKTALALLKKTQIYVQRIDYFLSDDDSEESFHNRLKEELKQLEK